MTTTASTKARNYCIIRHPRAVARSRRVLAVASKFGLGPENRPVRIVETLRLGFAPGSITCLAGPSGSGKSALLATIARTERGARLVERVVFPRSRAIVDGVATRHPLAEALSILTACGLGEPRLWLRDGRDLSDGERFRARMARAVGLQLTAGAKGPLLCDEFCTGLHRRAAKAIAFNLGKLTRRRNLALVVATSQDDLIADLAPDRLVRFDGLGGVALTGGPPERESISFAHRLVIEPGGKSDYARFAAMHYRNGPALGFVDKVFVLRDGIGGDPLAVVVYAYPPIELSLRNKATGGRFVRNPGRLNREMRILRRLVVHPDVRGCGLGRFLVAETLGRLGTPYVECLAAMGQVNPVFEKAGMRRVGVCPAPPERQRIVQMLTDAGADPTALDFTTQVCRRPRIRRLVIRGVTEWWKTVSGQPRPGRVMLRDPVALAQAFRHLAGSRPVYYLWSRDGAFRP